MGPKHELDFIKKIIEGFNLKGFPLILKGLIILSNE